MNKERIEFYRNRLTGEKRRLQTELANVHNENVSVARSGSGGCLGTSCHGATFDQEKDLSLEENLVDISGQVDGALHRIETGKYGFCARCHEPISEERLSAIPYASLCLADQERLEGPR